MFKMRFVTMLPKSPTLRQKMLFSKFLFMIFSSSFLLGMCVPDEDLNILGDGEEDISGFSFTQ